ncbi:hypothetical protein [Helicobacter rodentium]|uniref:hypothetical protein n=1 Tax=Helicobacter rodentium TaxID=59617 RepID=UPI0012EBB9FE|nr:hypothetical protein [Helicobacter rodentium]
MWVGCFRNRRFTLFAMTEKYVLKAKLHYGLLRSLLLSRNNAVVSILSLRGLCPKQSIIINYFKVSIAIFILCLIMDCHDSANAESRNDGEICFKGKTALWIASSLAPLIPRNDKAES